MSAPHYYESDRLCVVVSGTWWVTSGDVFDPNSTVPVKAGSFVHRIARTSHYDGVKAGEPEPVVIAICVIRPDHLSPGRPLGPQGTEGFNALLRASHTPPDHCRTFLSSNPAA